MTILESVFIVVVALILSFIIMILSDVKLFRKKIVSVEASGPETKPSSISEMIWSDKYGNVTPNELNALGAIRAHELAISELEYKLSKTDSTVYPFLACSYAKEIVGRRNEIGKIVHTVFDYMYGDNYHLFNTNEYYAESEKTVKK